MFLAVYWRACGTDRRTSQVLACSVRVGFKSFTICLAQFSAQPHTHTCAFMSAINKEATRFWPPEMDIALLSTSQLWEEVSKRLKQVSEHYSGNSVRTVFSRLDLNSSLEHCTWLYTADGWGGYFLFLGHAERRYEAHTGDLTSRVYDLFSAGAKNKGTDNEDTT